MTCRETIRSGLNRGLDCGRTAVVIVRQARGTGSWPMCKRHADPYIRDAKMGTASGTVYSRPVGWIIEPIP